MMVSVFSILVAVNYGDHLEKLKSSLIFTFYGFMQLIIPMMTIIILIWKTKKNKLGSKWGEMMSTEKPLVRDKTKKKGFKGTKE